MMRQFLVFLLAAALLMMAFPASAQTTTQCWVGTAVVTNGAEDQTIEESIGLVWGIGDNLIYGPRGEAKLVTPGEEVTVYTPNTEVPLDATFIDVYPSDTEFGGILSGSVSPCAPSAPSASAASHGLPAYTDGRLIDYPWASATLYPSAAGKGFDLYSINGQTGAGIFVDNFDCAELQSALDDALKNPSPLNPDAQGHFLLADYTAGVGSPPPPIRPIKLWAVPSGSGSYDLVLISQGQGGDNSKNTVAPLPDLCPSLQL